LLSAIALSKWARNTLEPQQQVRTGLGALGVALTVFLAFQTRPGPRMKCVPPSACTAQAIGASIAGQRRSAI
jgi:hypothetical protein